MEKEFVDTLKELVETAKTVLLVKIVEKSELTEDQAEKIAEEIKAGVASRHENNS
ncbi:MAG: hypothetical protein PWR13_541 [Archaeoglobi archaeon]|nr:hypothetical protein [Archaeoglobi archaeon]